MLNFVLLGIALFTYHKYQKSLDSSIQIDAHGNPIETSDIDGGGAYIELDQSIAQRDLVSLI